MPERSVTLDPLGTRQLDQMSTDGCPYQDPKILKKNAEEAAQNEADSQPTGTSQEQPITIRP